MRVQGESTVLGYIAESVPLSPAVKLTQAEEDKKYVQGKLPVL
jgi:hypothetical protein